MQEFFVGAFLSAVLAFLIIGISNPYQKGMIAVASGQYSCELEERVDKTTEWVCERVK